MSESRRNEKRNDFSATIEGKVVNANGNSVLTFMKSVGIDEFFVGRVRGCALLRAAQNRR